MVVDRVHEGERALCGQTPCPAQSPLVPFTPDHGRSDARSPAERQGPSLTDETHIYTQPAPEGVDEIQAGAAPAAQASLVLSGLQAVTAATMQPWLTTKVADRLTWAAAR